MLRLVNKTYINDNYSHSIDVNTRNEKDKED